MNNNLNVFKYGYYPWKYPSCILSNIKHFFKTLKYAYQRATKGYSDWDVWDLDYYYTNLFVVTLRELAETSHSYPGTNEFPTYESWVEYLNKMADLFEASLEDFNKDENIYEKEYDALLEEEFNSKEFKEIFGAERSAKHEEIAAKWAEEERRIYNKKVEKRNEALKMLSHVYDTLWD